MMCVRGLRLRFYSLLCMNACAEAFILGWWVQYLLSKGFRLWDVTLSQACFFAILIMLEVPTGALADVVGRRHLMKWGVAIRGLAMVLYVLAGSRAGLVVAAVVDGLGCALSSGALESWAVDALRAAGEADPRLDRLFSTASTLTAAVSTLVGWVGVALLSRVHASIPFYAAAIGFGATYVVAARLMVEERSRQRGHLDVAATYRQARGTVLKVKEQLQDSPALRLFFASLLARAFVLQGIAIGWQPYFVALGAGRDALGYLWVASALGGVAGAYLSRHGQRVGPAARTLMLGTLVQSGLVLALAVAPSLPTAAVAFASQIVVASFLGPIRMACLNRLIPAGQRATFLSFGGSLDSCSAMVALLVLGQVADHTSLVGSWWVCGLALMASSLCFALMPRLLEESKHVAARGSWPLEV